MGKRHQPVASEAVIDEPAMIQMAAVFDHAVTINQRQAEVRTKM